MNKVVLVGRLTRDPELRYTSSNLANMRCSLAVDRQYAREGEERGTDFINIVAFGQRAETMNKYLTKGSQIAVDGRIQTGSYDGTDGKKVYTTDVIVENFQFLDTRNRGNVDVSNADDFSSNGNTTSNVNDENNSDPFADFGAKIEVSDSELPF